MNGPIRMYRTKQIINHSFSVDLPKCMYNLKNIHLRRNGMVDGSADHVSTSSELDIFDQVKQFLKNNQFPEMAELEAKQEEILNQLAELKKQILLIKTELKIGPAVVMQSVRVKKNYNAISSENINKEKNGLPDIVINASPVHPPFSLEIIQKLLKDVINLNVISHIHSSIDTLTAEAKELETSLINFKSNQNVPRLNIRLIWKNVGFNMESLVTFTPILGEVNFLRYLSRLIESPLNYYSTDDSVEIDSLLDICYLLVRAKTKSEQAVLIQNLSKSLGKSQWLAGRNKPSIVDIAAYSAIKQVSAASKINVGLSKWFQRCQCLA